MARNSQSATSWDPLELAARILACPDCGVALSSSLQCPSCGRSLTPHEDGIISALPIGLQRSDQNKDQLQQAIDAAAPGQRGERIVLYESAFHDEQARYYDDLFADPLPLAKYYEHLVCDQIYSYVQQKSFVVDLCCGTGKSSLPLVERGMFVVGMDVSREMLRAYQQKCVANGHANVLLVHADASRPPLRGQSCGAISMIGGLHHIEDREGSVNSCCKALAAEGLLIFHEPLKMGRSHKGSVLLQNLYALADPSRVWRAAWRRLGLGSQTKKQAIHESLPDFTPYEKPFKSPEELLAVIPRDMRPLVVRSQGFLSFRQFPPYLQGWIGLPLASLIVTLDDRLSRNGNSDWSGDALFTVFRKTSE